MLCCECLYMKEIWYSKKKHTTSETSARPRFFFYHTHNEVTQTEQCYTHKRTQTQSWELQLTCISSHGCESVWKCFSINMSVSAFLCLSLAKQSLLITLSFTLCYWICFDFTFWEGISLNKKVFKTVCLCKERHTGLLTSASSGS